MVRGLDKFKEYFKEYTDCYIIIGGTACDIIINDAGLTPRATKDIDIILVIEALRPEFVKQFWKFIRDGNYGKHEKSREERKYYRFLRPAIPDFPQQVEFFSRVPDLLEIVEGSHLTPIPVDDNISNLSAILLDDDYYNFTIEHSTNKVEVNIANTEALICLKVKAFLELTRQKENGEQPDEKHIKKHKGDVFRLAILFTAEDVFELPESIKIDMQVFAEKVQYSLPDKAIFRIMGAGDIDVKALFAQFLKNFNISN
jgi:hypothetical protein